jgi:hypothetical protein
MTRRILSVMASLEITIKKRNGRVLIDVDADRFEKLAADFGFFSDSFLKSLERAEKDVKAGRIRKVQSLKELREE